MAKAFLLRWGTQSDFDSAKLHIREAGFSVDNERLLVGGEDDNIHIPNETYVSSMIAAAVPKYKPIAGTTVYLATSHLAGGLAYNIDTKKLIYKSPSATPIIMASTADLPAQEAFSVSVEAANIDAGDNDSVILTGYTRPIEMIFKNGLLCTTNASDTRKYVVDRVARTLKVFGCAENDIIAYF